MKNEQNEFKQGQKVMVYDGDFIGYTLATLKKRVSFNELGVIEKWTMFTQEGYTLMRFVKTGEPSKDGCGYIIEM